MSLPIATHRPCLGADELSAVERVFASGWLGQGNVSQAFEDALRARLGVGHVVAVSSGTAALHLALEALDLPESSGVLVPSLTFVASIQAILAARLRPVFCEIDPETLQLDLDDTRMRLTAARASNTGAPRPRVVMPVHFGGASCDMQALQSLADEQGLLVVEDAAHAFGSSSGGRALGTFGAAGCFSFDPIKTITCGEGGAVATSREDLAARLRQARCLGITADGWSRHTGTAWRYDVQGQGWRYHLPNLNAAIGLAQLPRLDEFRTRRQEIVRRYDAALRPLAGVTPLTRPRPDTCPFTFVVRVGNGRRDALMAHLRAAGIGTSVEYIPNHLHQAFAAYRTALPATEQAFAEILSLPLHAGLSDEDVTAVVCAMRAFFADGDES